MAIQQSHSWRELLKYEPLDVETIARFAIAIPKKKFRSIFRKFLLENGNPTMCIYEYCAQRKIPAPNVVECFQTMECNSPVEFSSRIEFPDTIKFPICSGKTKKKATYNASMIAMIYLLVLHEEEILEVDFDSDVTYTYQLRYLNDDNVEWLIDRTLEVHEQPECYKKYLNHKIGEIEDISVLFRHSNQFNFSDVLLLKNIQYRLPKLQLMRLSRRHNFKVDFATKEIEENQKVSITLNIEFDDESEIMKNSTVSKRFEKTVKNNVELVGERRICKWALNYLFNTYVYGYRLKDLMTTFDEINLNVIQEIQSNNSLLGQLALAGNQKYFATILQMSPSRTRASKMVAFASCADGIHQHLPQQFFKENIKNSGRYLHDMSLLTMLRRSFCMYLNEQIQKLEDDSSSSIFENILPQHQSKVFDGTTCLRLCPDVSFNLFLNFIPDGCAFDVCEMVNESNLNNVSVDRLAYLENLENDISHFDAQLTDEIYSRMKDVVKFEKNLWHSGHHMNNLRESYAQGRVTAFHVKDVNLNESIPIDREEMNGTLPMSSTDKLTQWQILGWQGSLMSSLIKPVYMSSITIADKNFHYETLCSAFCCRMSDYPLIQQLPQNFVLKHPRIGRPYSHVAFPKLKSLITEFRIKSEQRIIHDDHDHSNSFLVLYAADVETYEIIDTSTGLETDFSHTKTNSFTPLMCKLGNLNRFLFTLKSLNKGSIEFSSQFLDDNDDELLYEQFKQRLGEMSGYSLAKRIFRQHIERCQFGRWKSVSHLLNHFPVPISK
ncbi:hypothetical protein SNEBB_001495 [Seison nebaliae]|nr:hypothetical protein SNEBB_001495 [Seison nebaliae]